MTRGNESGRRFCARVHGIRKSYCERREKEKENYFKKEGEKEKKAIKKGEGEEGKGIK